MSTKGVWYPDRTKATEKDPPLYLHIAATTNEILQKAIERVNELIALDMGSLVEDKKDRGREKVRFSLPTLGMRRQGVMCAIVVAKMAGGEVACCAGEHPELQRTRKSRRTLRMFPSFSQHTEMG